MTLKEWFQHHQERSKTGATLRERWLKKPRNAKALKDAQGKPTNVEDDPERGIVGGKPTATQTVHTPASLRNEMWKMLFRSQEEPMRKGSKILVLNAEFLDNIHSYGIMDQLDVTLVTDNKAKIVYVRQVWPTVKIEEKYFLDWKTDMKFDVIVGNPPYQAPQEREEKSKGRSGTTLWDKFVLQSINLLKTNGYLCCVHPSGWREPRGTFTDVKNSILDNSLLYLEMHNADDGNSTFGAATCYDWYVLKIGKRKVNTKINVDGKVLSVNLENFPFIPNGMFAEVSKLIATSTEKKVDFIYSSSGYESRKLSKEQDKNFKHPVVYTITDNGKCINYLYSNTNQNGHFGIPKVIFSNGAGCSPIIDENGEYGMSQFAYGIADEPENLVRIQKAMMTPKFLQLMKCCQMTGFNRYSWKSISTFKKDFWKHFVDDKGNELP